MEPVTASSKPDLPLAKAEEVSSSGGNPRITDLRSRGKVKAQQHLQTEKRGVRLCERNTLVQTPRSVKEREEVFQAPNRSCSL